MADYTSELIILLVSLPVGYLGKTLQDSQAARRARRQDDQQRWDGDRESVYLPLLSGVRDLDDRLTALAGIYRGEPAPGLGGAGLSADFRELYQLSPEPIHDLYAADPNQPRRDQAAVQRVRTRMCRELNYATSTLYRTARYLALADLTTTGRRPGTGSSLGSVSIASTGCNRNTSTGSTPGWPKRARHPATSSRCTASCPGL